MSENLFSKYRPKSLDEIFGRDKLVKEFKKRFKEKNISHSSFFEGTTGTGKTTLMRIIAKTILCQNKDSDGNSCNTCNICQVVDQGKLSNNYFELNASNLTIDAMRDLEEFANKRILGQYNIKVFLIDEMQELNKSKAAEKNILPLIEKHNENTYFLLGTMDSSKVIDAIKDRGTYYKLKPFTFQDISKCLEYICKKENVIIDTKDKASTLITIAQNSNGSMRKAVGYLERAIFSDIWTSKELIEELDIISDSDLTIIINYIFNGDVRTFNYKINEEVLKKLNYLLMLYYKKLNKVELNRWQLSQVRDIAIHSIKKCDIIMKKLNELSMYPYLYPELIEYYVLQAINEIKSCEVNITK